MAPMQPHVRVTLTPESDCSALLAAPQNSFPLIVTFGVESFSCAVLSGAGAAVSSNEPLVLSFSAPTAALQFAVPGAQFTFTLPPECTGMGVVFEALGA